MAMWEENLKRYDELIAKCPRFERKGKTMPYTSSNGYMFSLLNKKGGDPYSIFQRGSAKVHRAVRYRPI